MKHKPSHWLFLTNDWLLYTNLVFLFSLFAFWLFEKTAFEVVETLLAPWFVICRALTPASWQVEKNIILGLMYFFSGLAVYSMLIGACLVTCGRYISRRRLREPGFNARARHP